MPTKITISKEDLESALTTWLNQKILKNPVSKVAVKTVGTQYNSEVESATFEVDFWEEADHGEGQHS